MNQIKERKKGTINMAKTQEQSFSGDQPPTYGSSQRVLTGELTILTLQLAATTKETVYEQNGRSEKQTSTASAQRWGPGSREDYV